MVTNVEDRGLTIGGYKSAWLADLAMAFLLETINEKELNKTKYFGIYCDDGIAVFPGTWMQFGCQLSKEPSTTRPETTSYVLWLKY
jgi:hypothetical protein